MNNKRVKWCLFGYKCVVVMGVLEMLGPYSDGFDPPDGDDFVEIKSTWVCNFVWRIFQDLVSDEILIRW